MRRAPLSPALTVGAGAVAGIAGTVAMLAMRSFDERYAPATIPPAREDPADFLAGRAERAAGPSVVFPRPAKNGVTVALRLAYGAIGGVLYALTRGRGRHRSALADGAVLGAVVYAAGYVGWLPALGLTPPLRKQAFPAIAGEGLRHVAYGVATVAAYGAINAMR